MTFHAEAREAVARLVWTCWNWEPTDTPWEQLTDTQGGKIDARDYADLILARLGELGYGDIDQMSRIATSEHFADLHKFKDRLLSEEAIEAAADALSENMVKGVVYLEGRAMVRLAIAAAIAKAGEPS